MPNDTTDTDAKAPWWLTVFGFLLVAAAFVALFMRADFSEWALVVLAVLGGFFISLSRMKAFLAGIANMRDIVRPK